MQYLLLIYSDEDAHANASPDGLKEMYAAYGRFTKELQDAGKLGAAEELQSSRTAKSVTVKDGQPVVMDGPYAEVREQLGGFYVIDVADMDEAVAWAARVPSASFGTVEVRPLATGAYPEAG
jgi:hypothetical protein